MIILEAKITHGVVTLKLCVSDTIMVEENGPWKIKTSEIKYKNPYIEVAEDDVIGPDGNSYIYGKIKIVPGVSVLPIDENGFVYLIKEFKYAIGKYSTEVVCGGIKPDEDDISAARRELMEEVGISASEFISVGDVHAISNIVNSRNALFLAKNLAFGKPDREGTEVMETLKMPFKDAVKMVMDGTIQRAPSRVLILKADIILKKDNG